MINYGGTFAAKKDVAIVNLPAGAYVGKIISAKVEAQSIAGVQIDRLVIELDVAEGEYKGHYTKLYEAASGGMYPDKYKGVYRITIPREGDKYEAMNLRILEHSAWALEQSNKGYHWDMDESKLKGLSVGFSVREADYLIEDAQGIRSGTTTEICRLESAAEVKAGTVKTPKRRELKEAQKAKLAAASAAETFVEVEQEDLPF